MDLKPDMALYEMHNRAQAAFQRDMEAANAAEAQLPDISARAAWAWMVSAGEVKPNERRAGFHFKYKGFLINTPDGRKARAQYAKYATEIMLRQHRTHLFTFYISGCWVRVFYWDRNGCVVSQPANLNTNPERFANFVFRLLKLTRKRQGYDDSVQLAKPDEIVQFRNWNPDNQYLREHRELIFDNEEFYPIYRVSL